MQENNSQENNLQADQEQTEFEQKRMLLHPRLQAALPLILDQYSEFVEQPYYARLAEGHRSLERQLQLFNLGRSKVDGIRRFGKHNFLPSFAMDLWIYDDQGTLQMTDDRPTWTQKLYMPFGELAIRHDLEWGGHWRSFFDGPHFQIGRHERANDVQMLLACLGHYRGRIDGILGPYSRAAMSEYYRITFNESYPNQLTPEMWRSLFESSLGNNPAVWPENYFEMCRQFAVV